MLIAFTNKMTMDWTTTGYPPKHYEVSRAVRRSTIKTMGSTGLIFVLTLVATMYFGLPPVVAAFAMAIFLLVGLMGGMTNLIDTICCVRVMLYFERELGGIDTFQAGYALARYLMQLDTLAVQQGVSPISTFGFADDLRGETLVWHDAGEGLQCVRTLRAAIEGCSMPTRVRDAIANELAAWEPALSKASAEDVKFCVLLMHGNSTSGYEWDLRKGSAY